MLKKSLAWLLSIAMLIGAMSGLALVSSAGGEEAPAIGLIDFTTGEAVSSGSLAYSTYACGGAAEMGFTDAAPGGGKALYVKNEGTTNVQFTANTDALKDADGNITFLVYYYAQVDNVNWSWLSVGDSGSIGSAGNWAYRAAGQDSITHPLGALTTGKWEIGVFTIPASVLKDKTVYLAFGACGGTIYVDKIAAGPAAAVAADKAAAGNYDSSMAYIDFNAQPYPTYLPGVYSLKENKAVWGPEELEVERGWMYDAAGTDISSQYANLSANRVVINTANGASGSGNRVETDYQVSAEGVRYLTRKIRTGLGTLIGEAMLSKGAKEYKSYLALDGATYKMPDDGVPVAADIEATLDPSTFYSYTYVNIDDAFVAEANTTNWIIRVDVPKGHNQPAALQGDTGAIGSATGFSNCGCSVVKGEGTDKYDTYYYVCTAAAFSNKSNGKDFRMMIQKATQGIVAIAAYPTADKTELAAAITAAGEVATEGKDEAKVAALAAALEAAGKVNENAGAAQYECDAAVADLNKAITKVQNDGVLSSIDFSTGEAVSTGAFTEIGEPYFKNDPAYGGSEVTHCGIEECPFNGGYAFRETGEKSGPYIPFKFDPELVADEDGNFTFLVRYYRETPHDYDYISVGTKGGDKNGQLVYTGGSDVNNNAFRSVLSTGAWDVAEFTYNVNDEFTAQTFTADKMMYLNVTSVKGAIYIDKVIVAPTAAVAADKAAAGNYDSSVAYIDFNYVPYPTYLPGGYSLKTNKAVWGPEELETERGWMYDADGTDISNTYPAPKDGRVIINTANGASGDGNRVETDYKVSAEGVRYLTRKIRTGLGTLIGELMVSKGAKEYKSYLALDGATYKMPDDGVPVAADIEATLDPSTFYSYTYVNIDDAFVAEANTTNWIIRVDVPKGHNQPAALQGDTGAIGSASGFGNCGATVVKGEGDSKVDTYYYVCTAAAFSNKSNGKDFRMMIQKANQGIVAIAAYPAADKTELAAAIEAAGKVDGEGKDEAKVAALAAALVAAGKVNDNAGAAQSEVDEAAKALNAAAKAVAIDGLPSMIDFTSGEAELIGAFTEIGEPYFKNDPAYGGSEVTHCGIEECPFNGGYAFRETGEKSGPYIPFKFDPELVADEDGNFTFLVRYYRETPHDYDYISVGTKGGTKNGQLVYTGGSDVNNNAFRSVLSTGVWDVAEFTYNVEDEFTVQTFTADKMMYLNVTSVKGAIYIDKVIVAPTAEVAADKAEIGYAENAAVVDYSYQPYPTFFPDTYQVYTQNINYNIFAPECERGYVNGNTANRINLTVNNATMARVNVTYPVDDNGIRGVGHAFNPAIPGFIKSYIEANSATSYQSWCGTVYEVPETGATEEGILAALNTHSFYDYFQVGMPFTFTKEDDKDVAGWKITLTMKGNITNLRYTTADNNYAGAGAGAVNTLDNGWDTRTWYLTNAQFKSDTSRDLDICIVDDSCVIRSIVLEKIGDKAALQAAVDAAAESEYASEELDEALAAANKLLKNDYLTQNEVADAIAAIEEALAAAKEAYLATHLFVDFSSGEVVANKIAYSVEGSLAFSDAIDGIKGIKSGDNTRYNYMKLDLDDAAVLNADGSKHSSWKVTVKYYDNTEGSMLIQYQKAFVDTAWSTDEKNATTKNYDLAMANSGEWVTETFTINDAYFDTSAWMNGCDSRISFTPTSNFVIARVEFEAIGEVAALEEKLEEAEDLLKETDEADVGEDLYAALVDAIANGNALLEEDEPGVDAVADAIAALDAAVKAVKAATYYAFVDFASGEAVSDENNQLVLSSLNTDSTSLKPVIAAAPDGKMALTGELLAGEADDCVANFTIAEGLADENGDVSILISYYMTEKGWNSIGITRPNTGTTAAWSQTMRGNADKTGTWYTDHEVGTWAVKRFDTNITNDRYDADGNKIEGGGLNGRTFAIRMCFAPKNFVGKVVVVPTSILAAEDIPEKKDYAYSIFDTPAKKNPMARYFKELGFADVAPNWKESQVSMLVNAAEADETFSKVADVAGHNVLTKTIYGYVKLDDAFYTEGAPVKVTVSYLANQGSGNLKIKYRCLDDGSEKQIEIPGAVLGEGEDGEIATASVIIPDLKHRAGINMEADFAIYASDYNKAFALTEMKIENLGDPTALEEAIAAAEANEKTDGAPRSVAKALDEALANAQDIIENGASQEVIDAAVAALNEAVAAAEAGWSKNHIYVDFSTGAAVGNGISFTSEVPTGGDAGFQQVGDVYGWGNKSAENVCYAKINLDDNFVLDKYGDKRSRFAVKVTYLDKGVGSVLLQYQHDYCDPSWGVTAEAMATTASITIADLEDSGEWKTATVEIEDAYFDNSKIMNGTDSRFFFASGSEFLLRYVEFAALSADVSELEAALAIEVPTEGVSEGILKAYDDAVAAAEAVIADDDCTDSEIEKALEDLNAAIDAVELAASKAALAAVIDSVPEDLVLFTEETVTALNAALETAKAALDNAEATKKACDKAAANLQKAIDGLHNAKDDLQAAVDSALEDLSDYTEATAKAYTDALAAAKATLEKEGLTAADCIAAIDALEKAADGLLPDTDKAALQTVVDEALEDLSAYTEESAKAYSKALEEAKKVLENPKSTQDEIDAAVKALKDAKEALASAAALGDVDGNGKVDSTDARMILQYYAQKIGADDLNLNVADVNKDGKVDSTDARLILQLYAQKISAFPDESAK